MTGKIVRIGGASGFWGDTAAGARQLVAQDDIDYLIFDYLAEVTMSILSKAQARNPLLGYATDFVTVAMRDILSQAIDKNIRIVSNAGGVNPKGCAAALQAMAKDLGLNPRIAVVEGDDILSMLPQIASDPGGTVREMATGAPLPAGVMSANAYLGAFPIARAFALGADIVITGRCVDSALVLGPLIHEFGWTEHDLDMLAGGSLAGHLVECGPQATGGIFTDWDEVPDWHSIGFPIAECEADGSFVLTKPPGTGGLVARGVAAEQMLYEIGDPGAYILPDVVCDFTNVSIEEIGTNRVRIAGARGVSIPAAYKISATYRDGYRCTGGMTVIGVDAARKARRNADAILMRAGTAWRDKGLGEAKDILVELVGTGELALAPSREEEATDVSLRISVWHESREALEIFAREVTPVGTGGAPGTTGFSGGRPKAQEVVRLYSFLLPKTSIPKPTVSIADISEQCASVEGTEGWNSGHANPPLLPVMCGDEIEVPLVKLAWARSGDKGNISNIGVIARDPELYGVLAREVTAERVAACFGDLVQGGVERYALPGIHAFNFVMADALGGGGMASLRLDPQGKSFGQILLQLPVRVSSRIVNRT